MDRQFLAATASMVFIVLCVALVVHADSPTQSTPVATIAGNAFATAIANGAPTTNDVLPPLSVTLQANAGTVQPQAMLTLGESVIRLVTSDGAPSVLQTLSLELAGSSGVHDVTFTVGHGTSPDWANNPVALAPTQADDGTWYTRIDAAQLAALKAKFGSGWYVFTGTANRDTERAQSRIAFFVS